MKVMTKIILVLLILFLCVGCDQVTKRIAQTHLAPSQTFSYLGGVFLFHYTENKGAMLGLGAGLPEILRTWGLTLFNGVLLLGMFGFVVLSKEIALLGVLGCGLMIGGGISNILDRLMNDGAVVDFMNIGIGPLRTGVFNVADLAIMVGVGLIALWGFRLWRIEAGQKSGAKNEE